jgi:hypothetical protein
VSEVNLFFVIYSSTATTRLSQRDLLALLNQARINNEAHQLTGMLLYRDGTYLQYLEGSSHDIYELVTRLHGDPRHTDIRILRQGSLPTRLFPDWSMAYKNLMGLKSAQTPGYSERLQANYRTQAAAPCLQTSDPPPCDPAQPLIDLFTDTLNNAPAR